MWQDMHTVEGLSKRRGLCGFPCGLLTARILEPTEMEAGSKNVMSLRRRLIQVKKLQSSVKGRRRTVLLPLYLAATAKGPERKAVLSAHGARLASASYITQRFDGLSWRDDLDLASDGWDVWGLDYVSYGGSDRCAAMA
jgi:hypothetical protein